MNGSSKCEAKFQNSPGNIYSYIVAKKRRAGNSMGKVVNINMVYRLPSVVHKCVNYTASY